MLDLELDPIQNQIVSQHLKKVILLNFEITVQSSKPLTDTWTLSNFAKSVVVLDMC